MICPVRMLPVAALLLLLLSLGCGGDPAGVTDDGGDGGGKNGGDLNQSGPWMWANPTPQGDPVVRMRFASATTVYAVTGGGAVLKSIDAGRSWEVAYEAIALQVAPYGGLGGLHCLDEKRVWVVGTTGQITRTRDGGHTWSDHSIASIREMRDVWFIDDDRGFVVGDAGEFHRTDNGGVSWTPVAHTAGSLDLTAIVFSGTTGWVGGEDGTILRSDDNGATWTKVTVNWSQDIVVADAMSGGLAVFGTKEGATVAMISTTAWRFLHGGDTVMDVQFEDENNGQVLYIENNASYLATRTAGIWEEHALGLPQLIYTLATNGGRSVVAGWNGYMAYSGDGGVTWQSGYDITGDANPYTTQFFDVCFGDAGNGVTVGSGGAVLYSRDGGLTWNTGNSGTGEELLGVWLHSSGRGYAVGEGGTALRTTDGGATWSPMTMPVTVARFRDVSMWDEMNAILVGDGTSTQETILITADGGDTWVNRGPDTAPIRVSVSAWALGTQLAYVGQGQGAVLRTPDRGQTWQEFDSGTNNAIHQIQFVNDTHGWGATTQHDMVFTQDGGLTWTRIGPGTLPGQVSQVHFVDENVGIAVGPTGGMFRSGDGGASWTVLRGGLT
ncbi:MAG: YCF48-related protein, partial [Candidatus Krumholzibacteria bacterium]|nr:YCF48-related protein [Candidatus Krumholzibacteria bacterium]